MTVKTGPIPRKVLEARHKIVHTELERMEAKGLKGKTDWEEGYFYGLGEESEFLWDTLKWRNFDV